jgi:4-hydroxythreonine-4-phosphate dehydrogenase
MRPIVVTSGEPAGIGPDLCLALAGQKLKLVILADKQLLYDRAKLLGLTIIIDDYYPNKDIRIGKNILTVMHVACVNQPIPGALNKNNAVYVLEMLDIAAKKCLSGEFKAMVTCPVHKGIINQAGIIFTGHTEFLANLCQVDKVVMLLSSKIMRVALVTTHVPLQDVSKNITKDNIEQTVLILDKALKQCFKIKSPNIYIAGLNPHAGEGGYLGREELDTIIPAIENLKNLGLNVYGPIPADTMYIKDNLQKCDAFVAMYHDQGLPVIKYADFDGAVNVTLGLPIIRTSVDHGSALNLAAKGVASKRSLFEALNLANLLSCN